MTRISTASTQFLWVPVRSEHPINGEATLTSTTVEVAIVDTGTPESGDWETATWESSDDTINGVDFYLAKIKVGPSGTIGPLTAGTWNVWVRVTSADETVVMNAGQVTLY